MTTFARTLQKNNVTIYVALLLADAALLIFSPAEATLGNVVKIVYAHGAAERVSMYAYLLGGALGLVALAINNASTARWARAATETAIVFWLVQFAISAPAQVLAWGAFTLNEPRVAGALWILALTALVYGIALWVHEPGWLSLAAVANAAIVIMVLRGEINILHPIDPIVGSDSITIKVFYAAIVLITGALALQFARDRAART
jgi:hypothetical protein